MKVEDSADHIFWCTECCAAVESPAESHFHHSWVAEVLTSLCSQIKTVLSKTWITVLHSFSGQPFAVWCNRGKTYWLLQSKAGCFESPNKKYNVLEQVLPLHFQEHHQIHEGWYDHLWREKQGVVTRGYSDNSKLPTWNDSPFGSLSGMLPCIKNVVLVSLLDAGRRWCQREICSHSEASTACSLSEHDGKCTSLFSIFTECKSVKPLMVCHLDGNCSPLRGRQVKLRACVFWVLMWKIFSLLGDYCRIYVQ